ncbi:hypothetical protein BU25DRAFT_13979 [Macroventuria anomochaeta]|uniref:Uncharacterized protein n=1 Tax=Macroventuria anomochaeta TaxID=301207 RepID=A0ACB6SJX2_9PLEO|nr:uncharacterized protein BU25DRAFT_13979 [Macroventuria anomochaeta]KAF2633849.1 hypothetical protein BU25DRAFT_13979 [Macroventuria anomochaeta]
MANLRAPAESTMAEARGVRAGSRRKTPTLQPEKAPARAPRRLRSQSRDIEPLSELQKPTRRSARQGSVTSIASESKNKGPNARKTKRKPAKEAAGDLTLVEEIDTEIAFDEAPATPQHIDIPLPLEQQTFRSPGAASEMSGTTAISSFSMIEAEFLEPKFIMKHMRKLCESAEEFLQHLAPPDGTITDDHRNIQEMLKPDSEFVEEYNDFDEGFKLYLKHFKGDENNYINIRAVHRALFGLYNEAGALQSGVNLVLYLANVLVFAKQMIHSDRSDKDVWNRLRRLDNSFPSQFICSLVTKSSPTAVGDSALLRETFELGLELRTQLAILSLERSASDGEFNPDEALNGIFLHSEASQENGDIIRGWSVAALGGEETSLSQEFQDIIVRRFHELRAFLPTDTQSLENGDLVDLDGLSSNFPWEATVLQLLQWTRLRHRELSASIEAIGGSTAILANVRKAVAAPQPAPEEVRPTTAPRDSPRKKRTSFGHRRRSSRKFDPNAPIDLRAIDALKARERDSGVHFDPKVPQPGDVFEEVAEEEDHAQQTVEEQPELEVAPEDAQAERELSEQIDQIEQDVWEQTPGGDDQQPGEATLVAGEDDFEDVDAIAPSGPPKSTQDILAALKSVQPTGKENRKAARFVDRQPNAVRVEFEDGFGSSQPTPGPSNRVLDKGKQHAKPPPSASRKRARSEEDEDDDDDDDAFESGDRTAHVEDRRQKAPISKRVRVEPPSSAPAPPSHQAVRASQTVRAPEDEELRISQCYQRVSASPAPTAPRVQQEDSLSETETEAPDMTETLPPHSTYQDQHNLARQNSAIGGAGRMRQPRRTWTANQEEALVEYMERFQGSYAQIEKFDRTDEGYGVLGDFTQVNLKDKARTMAVNMIKSGTGLRPGFEEIIKETSKDGKKLLEAGFTW